jgi:chromosomal replication initiation ATPase DnaA
VETNIAPPSLLRAMKQQRALLPDDDAAIRRLKGYLRRANPTWEEIKIAVCEFYVIDPIDLMVGRRVAENIMARQAFYYFAYKYTKLSMPQIGRMFGHADHTSVQHGIKQIIKQIRTRPLVRDDIDLLRLRICEKLMARPVRVTP